MNYFTSRLGASAGYAPLPNYDTHAVDTYELQTPLHSYTPSSSAPISRKPSLAPTYRTYSPSHLSPVHGNPFTALNGLNTIDLGMSEKGYPYHYLPNDRYPAYHDTDRTNTPYSLPSPSETYPCTCRCPEHAPHPGWAAEQGARTGTANKEWDAGNGPRMMSSKERAVVLSVMLGAVLVFGAFVVLMNAMAPVVEAAS